MSQSAKERILDILIVLAAIVLAIVIIYPQYKMAQTTKVKIAVDRSVMSLPVFIAQDIGYFKNEKVDPEIVIVNDPYERERGLTDNEYAFTILPWSSVLGDNHPYRVIGSAETRQLKPAEALLAVPKSKIKRVGDLRGKKIGLLAETEHYFDELKENLPLKVTKIKKVTIEPEEIGDVIRDHKVSGLFLFEPYRSYAVNKGATIIQDAPLAFYVQRGYPVAAYCFTKEFIEKNKVDAQRIKDAIDAAFRHIIRNSGEAKKLMYRKLNLEGGLLHTSLVEYQRLREINLEALRSYTQRFNLPGIPDSVVAHPLDFER